MSVGITKKDRQQTINLMVSGGLFDSQAGYHAWRFCRAALDAGQCISQVFFYQQAVTQSSNLAAPLADEFDATAAWRQLHADHDVALVVCISAAEKRGVLGAEQADELGKQASNLDSAFTIAGLGSFYAASFAADRTVTFR